MNTSYVIYFLRVILFSYLNKKDIVDEDLYKFFNTFF